MWAALAAIFSFLAALPKLIELLDAKLGTDWPLVLPQLTKAWTGWAKAQTPEEEDESIKAMGRALNRKPDPAPSAGVQGPPTGSA